MQVLINLVPEARLVKLKQKRNKRLLTTLTILTAIVMATIVGTLIVLIIANTALYAANEGAIKDKKSEIAEINKSNMEQNAATLQEHLASFKTLNDSRLYASKVFAEFSETIQPNVTVKTFDIADGYVVSVTGTAKSNQDVSKFVNAIEEYGTTYKKKPDADPTDYFTGVDIASVGKGGDSGGDGVSFSLTFKANESVFSKTNPTKSGQNNGH